MARPWEKYQQTAAPAAQGPWSRYQQPEQAEQAAGPAAPAGGRRGRYIPQQERQQAAEAQRRQRRQDLMPVDPYTPGSPLWSGDDPAQLGMAAVPEAVAAMATGAAAAPIAGLAGLFSAPFTDDAGGVVERVQGALSYQPRTPVGQGLTEAAAYPFERLAAGADVVGGGVARVTGSPALGATVNTAIQAAPALLLRGRVRGDGNIGAHRTGRTVATGEAEASASVPAQGGRRGRLGRVSEQAPSIDDLQAAKNAAYKRAEDSGVVVTAGAINRLKVDLYRDLQKEGLDQTLHPKSSAALQKIIEKPGDLTLTQIETLRKIANDARMSPDPSDARLGSRIIEKIDDFEANIGPDDVRSGSAEAATAYKEARALNQRLAKARTIQKLFDDAELAVGANYTAAGMDTALRQQFRSLAKNDKKLRGFTAAEKAAIRKVAMGGPVQNAMRTLGKFAPNGVVSSLAGIGAFSVAGPGGLILPAAGIVARHGAAKMGISNAARVSEMVRAGPGQAARSSSAAPRNLLTEPVSPR
jgi:hypothetical protein